MGYKSDEIFNEMREIIEGFIEDGDSWVTKRNKAAAARARKASLRLAALGKDFRKASVEEAKS